MRCIACDCVLTDIEAKRKGLFSREYLDLCDPCYATVADDVPLATGNDSLDDSLREEWSKPKEPTYGYDDGNDFQD